MVKDDADYIESAKRHRQEPPSKTSMALSKESASSDHTWASPVDAHPQIGSRATGPPLGRPGGQSSVVKDDADYIETATDEMRRNINIKQGSSRPDDAPHRSIPSELAVAPAPRSGLRSPPGTTGGQSSLVERHRQAPTSDVLDDDLKTDLEFALFAYQGMIDDNGFAPLKALILVQRIWLDVDILPHLNAR